MDGTGNPLGMCGSDHADAGVDKEEEKQKEISNEEWEEFLEALKVYELKPQFEKIYGPEPKLGIFWGRRRFSTWLDKFHIFVKGARAGEENAERVTMQSGWLKPEAQKMFEDNARKRKEEKG